MRKETMSQRQARERREAAVQSPTPAAAETVLDEKALQAAEIAWNDNHTAYGIVLAYLAALPRPVFR